MHWIRRTMAWLLVPSVVLTLALALAAGCRTASGPKEVQPGPAGGETEPADVMAQSDAERAKATLERDRREMSGERRPVDRDRRRVVDQPRAGGQR